MKRAALRASALLFLLLLPLVFLACKNAEEAAVLGRWETQATDEELGSFSMVYHFAEDGEIFIEQKQGDTIPFSIPFGTWNVKGERMTIESDGEEKTFTFSVQGDELTLQREGEDPLVFHRV